MAKFLGTPPITVFDGEVRGETLYIGEQGVLRVGGVADGRVSVGVRPEGFVPSRDGAFTCRLKGIEVMGRDMSILAEHEASHNPVIRTIVSADIGLDLCSDTVSFALKPHKVFLFDRESEVRLPFDNV